MWRKKLLGRNRIDHVLQLSTAAYALFHGLEYAISHETSFLKMPRRYVVVVIRAVDAIPTKDIGSLMTFCKAPSGVWNKCQDAIISTHLITDLLVP